MDLAGIVFGSIFTAAGLLFAAGKLHPHIAAWKNMPEEEKEKINIIPLCRNIGEIIFLSGILFLIKGFCPGFKDHWFTWSMIAWLVAAGVDLYFISKSDRYKKQ